MDMQTPVGEGQCPYPIREFNDATRGPVLFYAESKVSKFSNTAVVSMASTISS
jgi:hypothetical protein